METTMEPTVMAKKIGRPPKSTRDDATAKIDRKLLGKAQMIAKDQGVPVAELLSELIRGPIDRAYAKLVKKIDEGGTISG